MQLNHFALASDIISLPNTLDKSGVRSTLTQNTNPLQSSLQKFDRSSSIKNLKHHKEQQQLEALQQQNLMLKQEILFLRHKLKDGQMQKDHQALQLQAEVSRLKKIIEKSYYSIKNLQADKQTLYNDILDLKHISHKILTQSKALEQDKKILKIQLATIKNQHEEQINVVWQRVAHLQTNLEKMTMIIEEDRRQWKSIRVQSSQVSRPYHRRS